jgi:poly(3-hydroxybutyrate) depolymerase
VEDVRIPSTADGTPQPALWLAPGGDEPQPLLVVLHPWSSGYLQAAGIPFARWAAREGWALVAPLAGRAPERIAAAVSWVPVLVPPGARVADADRRR